MKKLRYVLYFILACCLLIGAGLFMVDRLFDWGANANSDFVAVPSPDGTYTATAFVRNCGATVPLSVHVYLGVEDSEVQEVGNVFRGTHTDQIKVQWTAPRTLEITTDAKVFLLMKEYAGISFVLKDSKVQESKSL